MRPFTPLSFPVGIRWSGQFVVIILATAVLWYSIAGANHILSIWGIWIPGFACFMVFPSVFFKPPTAIALTLVGTLAIETTYPDLRGWMIPIGLLISADLIRRRADYRVKSWNLMLIYGSAIHWILMVFMTLLLANSIGPSSAFTRKLLIDAMAGQVTLLLGLPALAVVCSVLGRLHLHRQEEPIS
ncbi:MAG: hypothetical protein JW706_04245 [Opitutales bacterium]|nr:hypothetical protein [Opitutales bacterium]